MAKVQDVGFMQQKTPSVFNPSDEADIKRRRKLAETMMEGGKQPDHTEVISGVAVQQSPLAALAKAIQSGIGGYQSGKADQAEAKMSTDRQQRLAQAIQSGKLDGLASGGPEEQMLALKNQMDIQGEDRKFGHDLQLARLKHAGGSGGGLTIDPETGAVTFSAGGSDAPSDPRRLAAAMGVPSVPQDVRGMSPKDASMLARQTRLDAQKQLNGKDAEEAMSKANNIRMDADRFEQLMAEQPTGGYRAIPGVAAVQGMFDPQMSEMSAIQDRLTPGMRAPGSGSTSDYDARIFANALPSAKKPEATNKNIIAAIKARSSDLDQYQSFRSDFLQANGHINGADKAWKEYLNANPIFDPNSTADEMKLNENRQDYKTFFQGGQQKLPHQDPNGPGQAAPPQGKLIGTSGGKRVFQLPDGSHVMEQ